jgi:RNA polymerase sigma-70 factor (ECF subfamily)
MPGGPEIVADLDAERALLEAVRRGRPEACEALVRNHGPKMRAVIVSILRSEADADDALQEAFLSAFRSLGEFEERARLSTWLHRIAVNAALMRLRARQRRGELEVEAELPRFTPSGVFEAAQSEWPDPDEDPVAREDLCNHVREAIALLPEKYRIPLLLRDIEGLSNQELARRLGVTPNAAKVRLHRARQALRALIEPRLLERAP